MIKTKIKEELKIIRDRIQKEGYTLDFVTEENGKLTKYHDIVTKEEIYWRKRSRIVWLKEGDKNTRFFHLFLMKHKAKTRISNLMKGDVKITKEKEILKELVSFFASLMSVDPNIDLLNQEEILRVIPSLITRDQNNMLGSIPNDKEIYQAIFSLGGYKSPGLDVFPIFFFQKEWNLVGKDV